MTTSAVSDPIKNFLSPTDLQVSGTPAANILMIGACLMDSWKGIYESLNPNCKVDRLLLNYAAPLPDSPPSILANYDFQVLSIPLRAVLYEAAYMSLQNIELEDYENLFRQTCARIDIYLNYAMKYNKDSSLLTFILGFLVPIANPLGRLMPRYDLRNMVYFIERLNEHLASRIAEYVNVYYIDIASVAACQGRKYIQDDALSALIHNSLHVNHAVNIDLQRLEPPKQSIVDHFDSEPHTDDFVISVWGEIISAFRTIRRVDNVKMIVMDLDDTLWRGIIGEQDDFDQMTQMEGWPLGIAEALTYLKKRGIILAIVSKNEESFISSQWDRIFLGRLRLNEFGFVRINWRPKIENIAEIIAIANIMPNNVVFVDDNPVERESVRACFPAIRVLGSSLYNLRRLLLWSAETQVSVITNESSRRGEMMRQQEIRENARVDLSREDFLESLDVKLNIKRLSGRDDKNFARALELVNKTNQFNTNGKRWSYEDFVRMIGEEYEFLIFFVDDKYSSYGLVGVVITKDKSIEQFVMSCRVVGMGIELAALSVITKHLKLKTKSDEILSYIEETERNFPCRDLYKLGKFQNRGDLIDNKVAWVHNTDEYPIQTHVEIVHEI